MPLSLQAIPHVAKLQEVNDEETKRALFPSNYPPAA
jgi:hypothetical protein